LFRRQIRRDLAEILTLIDVKSKVLKGKLSSRDKNTPGSDLKGGGTVHPFALDIGGCQKCAKPF